MLVINNHPSWNAFLTDEIISKLEKIENEIGDDYTPSKENILRFMRLDLANVKVIIIGQDPYFQEGAANGRSFQPALLKSWDEPFRQVSLKNILRLIYKSYFDEQLSYKEVLSKNAFTKSPTDWFDSLEAQGVLFLNMYLTCQIGHPNSHRHIWGDFVTEVIRYIEEKQNVIWFLWGTEANSCKPFIKGKIYSSNHPMMCGTNNPKDFLKSDCFLKTKDIINWLG